MGIVNISIDNLDGNNKGASGGVYLTNIYNKALKISVKVKIYKSRNSSSDAKYNYNVYTVDVNGANIDNQIKYITVPAQCDYSVIEEVASGIVIEPGQSLNVVLNTSLDYYKRENHYKEGYTEGGVTIGSGSIGFILNIENEQGFEQGSNGYIKLASIPYDTDGIDKDVAYIIGRLGYPVIVDVEDDVDFYKPEHYGEIYDSVWEKHEETSPYAILHWMRGLKIDDDTGFNIFVKHSGSIKKVAKVYVYKGGSFIAVKDAYVLKDNTFKKV